MAFAARSLRDQSGQAVVEFVGALPFVLLAGLLAWQLALIGNTGWLCANAARVAARAEAVGRDPKAAARSALPHGMERGLEVERRHAGGVRVHVRVPLLVHAWQTPVSVSAAASLGGPRR